LRRMPDFEGSWLSYRTSSSETSLIEGNAASLWLSSVIVGMHPKIRSDLPRLRQSNHVTGPMLRHGLRTCRAPRQRTCRRQEIGYGVRAWHGSRSKGRIPVNRRAGVLHVLLTAGRGVREV
jgi:hypothetical protein